MPQDRPLGGRSDSGVLGESPCTGHGDARFGSYPSTSHKRSRRSPHTCGQWTGALSDQALSSSWILSLSVRTTSHTSFSCSFGESRSICRTLFLNILWSQKWLVIQKSHQESKDRLWASEINKGRRATAGEESACWLLQAWEQGPVFPGPVRGEPLRAVTSPSSSSPFTSCLKVSPGLPREWRGPSFALSVAVLFLSW